MTTMAARMQERFARQAGTKLRGAAAERSRDRVRQADFLLRFFDRGDGVAERTAGAQVEGKGHGRELALVRMESGVLRSRACGKGAQRHRLAGGGFHVNFVEHVGGRTEVRLHFENDAVLVELRENDRDLALAERVVERVVDRLRSGRSSARPARGRHRC